MKPISRKYLKEMKLPELRKVAKEIGHKAPETRNASQLRAWIHNMSYMKRRLTFKSNV